MFGFLAFKFSRAIGGQLVSLCDVDGSPGAVGLPAYTFDLDIPVKYGIFMSLFMYWSG